MAENIRNQVPLDKNHPIPLYYQLVERIYEQIQSGELQPGDQIPSERELSEQAGISRMTVRQAISYLAQDGTLVVKPGVGTFVAEPKLIHDSLHMLGFTEEMMRQGEAVSSRVLEQVLMVPPPRIAAALHLKPTDNVVKIVRLRLSAGTPLLLETSFVPADLCPGLETQKLETQSLYQLLSQDYELSLKCTWQTVEATIANDYEAELFDFNTETSIAMILLRGVTYTETNKPVEYFKAIYRGDRFKIELVSKHCRPSADEPSTQRVSVLME